MNKESPGLDVIVTLDSGEVQRGLLKYYENGPKVTPNNGNSFDTSDVVSFKKDEQTPSILPLGSSEYVILKPLVTAVLGFSDTKSAPDIMYPESSSGWLSYIVDSAKPAVYTIQEIQGLNKSLLTIADIDDQILLDALLINPYESGILLLQRDWSVFNMILHSHANLPEPDLSVYIQAPPPSWTTMAKLVEGASVSKIEMRPTMGETMDQLVPSIFQETVREQIIAFLGWLDSAEIPNEDPAEFHQKYSTKHVFRALVGGHIRCILENVKAPNYIQVMKRAAEGHQRITGKTRSVLVERDPWSIALWRLYDILPDWMGPAVRYASSLNDGGNVVMALPVTKSDALKSQRAWSDRFGLVHHSFFMRGLVQNEAIGLTSAVYEGAAHRWPHKHLELSLKLGYDTTHPLQLQYMTFPISVIERIRRLLPTIKKIDWEGTSVNMHLYNHETREWSAKYSIIRKSVERKRSFRRLRNEFGSWHGGKPLVITYDQASVLDAITWGMYLRPLESGRYSEHYELSNRIIKDILEDLLDKGVLTIDYLFGVLKIKTACVIVEGPADRVGSIVRSFLLHTPTAHVRVADSGCYATIVTRLPEETALDFMTTFPNLSSNDEEITIRAFPISAYSGYRNNRYQRLWREGGVWDDDVSGLLGQARLLPKEDA